MASANAVMEQRSVHLSRDVDDGYFPAPFSIDPLPESLRLGMIAPGIAGILSAVTTLLLITFILWRLISWRRHYRTFIGYNQYVMLVLNLLIADFQQACAFLITWYWIKEQKIVAPHSACFAQGWLLHSGDVSSAFFVIAIAVHTFLTAVAGLRIRNAVFYGVIVFIWILSYVLTLAGVVLHPNDYFVRAGAWCWVSSKYETERLFLHYFWIFLVEFATIILYAIIFFTLRRRTNRLFNNQHQSLDRPNPGTVKAVNRITRIMTLYPLVYIICTLPISCGRMWSMANKNSRASDGFFLTAGTLLASCGWVDVLLYTLTRKRLLEETMPNRSTGHSGSHGNAIASTRTVTVQELSKTPFNMDEQLASNSLLSPQNQTFLDVKGARSDISTPPSRAGSIDPMLGSVRGVSWDNADKHFRMKQLLDEEREPEYLEMGAVKEGRMAAVPRKTG